MKAIILAAGLGTRLHPITKDIPKCMIDVQGKPLIEHQINWLKKNNITEIAINLHYLPDKIIEHLGDGSRFGVNLKYSFEKELLGTSGGVKNIDNFFDEQFLVFYGDNYTNLDLKELKKYHDRKKPLVTICLGSDLSEEVVSNKIVLDEHGKFLEFVEKPSQDALKGYSIKNISNTGIYLCELELLKFIPRGKSDFGKDIFPKLVNEQRVYGFFLKNKYEWYELGNIKRYNKYKNSKIFEADG